jgi:hypothetical protein
LAAVVLIGSLLAVAAAAQQPAALSAPAEPCKRNPSRAMLGGIDIDELRCRLAIESAQRNSLAEDVAILQAKAMLAENDLQAAQAGLATASAALAAEQARSSNLAEWFRAYYKPSPDGR